MLDNISYISLIEKQRSYYKTGETRSLQFRKEMLKRLRQAILTYEDEIGKALYEDLGKSEQEIVTTEIGVLLSEIKGVLKHLEKWNRKKSVKTNIFNLPGKSYTIREPYGVTLIISPWNYPFQLTISPLIGAIAGGNCSIIKPSEIASHTAKIIEKLIQKTFDEAYISVVQGGVKETNALLDERFDKIFFTGSTKVGKIVMEKAAKHLTPVILELGGKSPCVIGKSAKLNTAVSRIIFGKGINAGQTCVAPDYILVHEEIKEAFYEVFKEKAICFYGKDILSNADYGRIINQSHYNRIKGYLKDGRIVYGGEFDDEKLRIGLTLIEIGDLNTSIMKEEIFGPILPVITYVKQSEILDIINRNPDPLAMYVFSKDRRFVNSLIHHVHFGGGCINNTIMHLSNDQLPFGGRGTSGIGNYHGKKSFQAFTHEKSILSSSIRLDFKKKYPPYHSKNIQMLKRLMY